MKSLLVLVLALIFLVPLARTVLAAPAPAAAPNLSAEVTRLPFKGNFQSTEN